MFEKGKLIFKFWFQNGTYIEKEIVLDEDAQKEDVEKLSSAMQKIISSVKECFKEKYDGSVSVNNLIVRCSELIAFDIIPITEESEVNNASNN